MVYSQPKAWLVAWFCTTTGRTASDRVAGRSQPSRSRCMPKRELGGRGGWVGSVEKNGGPAGIAARARAAGLTWLVIKGGDGPGRWDQLTPDLVATIKDELPG